MVSVVSTQLNGMSDVLILPTGHVFMRYDDIVADEVIHFLGNGHFFQPDDSFTNPSGD